MSLTAYPKIKRFGAKKSLLCVPAMNPTINRIICEETREYPANRLEPNVIPCGPWSDLAELQIYIKASWYVLQPS